MEYKQTYRHLCESMWEEKRINSSTTGGANMEVIYKDVKKQLPTITNQQLCLMETHFKQRFYSEYKKYWNTTRVNRQRAKFEKFHQTFLNKEYVFDFLAQPIKQKGQVGRPLGSFKKTDDISRRTRDKRLDEIFAPYTVEELSRALERKKRNCEVPCTEELDA